MDEEEEEEEEEALFKMAMRRTVRSAMARGNKVPRGPDTFRI